MHLYTFNDSFKFYAALAPNNGNTASPGTPNSTTSAATEGARKLIKYALSGGPFSFYRVDSGYIGERANHLRCRIWSDMLVLLQAENGKVGGYACSYCLR